jgi:squalene-hopene/tetraprenyl-beta-curcumene cyclase
MEAIPFADHNAMQDPSCADITGRTVEALITCGVPAANPAIVRAIRYILSHQQTEGCWWGRWGVNYLYGTWQALGGLSAAGVLAPQSGAPGALNSLPEAGAKALAWLRSVQNSDGGFGESANSYLDRSLMGRGPSTASQTAWGLMSLLYLVRADDAAVERAVGWLCDHQLIADKGPYGVSRTANPATPDAGAELAPKDFGSDVRGAWNEHYFTGTGFPRVFYLRYNLYRHYFPVMALARYRRLAGPVPSV